MLYRGRLLALLLLAPVLSGCDVIAFFTTQAVEQQIDYINGPTTDKARLERVAPRVWTYNWHFDRTLVIDTDNGLVVVDPFSRTLATQLLAELRKAGVNKPVHTLIYTHYHMDHTRGGGALSPQNVICHVRCAFWWDKFPATETADVLRPTRTVDGDSTVTVGGVEIRLIDLANSHTDTNMAVLIPSQGVLYAADTVGIRALLPSGGVSVFFPDYLRALEKLDRLDFTKFVSSHFAWGTKADFHKAVQMQFDSWTWIKESVDAVGGREHEGVPLINNKDRVSRAYNLYYDKMKVKYGSWHGFDAQILLTYMNGFIAYWVGT